jgi:putative transposase
LRGVKLAISDAHKRLKTAIAEGLNASWQRCRVHFMCNVLADPGKQDRRVVSAFIGTALARTMLKPSGPNGRQVADQPAPERHVRAAVILTQVAGRKQGAAEWCRASAAIPAGTRC